MDQRQTLLCGSLLGLLGVALGAFGAHALKELLVENGRLETYELAVRYQFYHSLALLLIGSLSEKFGTSILRWAALFIFIGVVLFSGSLFAFALTNVKGFAMITPLGGVLMLIGWASMVYSILSKK